MLTGPQGQKRPAAGTDRFWSIEDIVTLVENAEVQAVVPKRSAILAPPRWHVHSRPKIALNATILP